MKAYLQKLMATAVLGLALSSNSLSAWAGVVLLHQVKVTSDGADGTMAGARYSADSTQYIGCSFSNTNTNLPFVSCSARDRNGKSSFCTSSRYQFGIAAKAIADFSYISFNVDPDGRSCSFLEVKNDSRYLR